MKKVYDTAAFSLQENVAELFEAIGNNAAGNHACLSSMPGKQFSDDELKFRDQFFRQHFAAGQHDLKLQPKLGAVINRNADQSSRRGTRMRSKISF